LFLKRKTSTDDRCSNQKTHHSNCKGVRLGESAEGAYQPEARSIDGFDDGGIVDESKKLC